MSNVVYDELDGLKRKFTIEIPQERVDKEIMQAYKAIQSQVSLPGFRKGKAPVDKLRPLYKEKVHQDVINNLISETYQIALSEHKVSPISYPKVDFKEFDEGKAFNFTAEFEVRPEVEVKNFEGLKVQKEIISVDDEKIQQVLENMQKSKASNAPVLEDRPAKEGDLAKIDFDGFVDGAPLEGGQAKDFDLELGSNSFIPGFEEGIVGMKISEEKSLDLNFPEEYHAKDIAGKSVTFKVKLTGLQKKSLPDINDEFAASFGEDDIKTVADLKKRITEDIEEGEKKRIDEDLKTRIMKALVEANPVPVPDSLFQEQKQKLIEDTIQRLKQQGLDEAGIEDYKSKWDEDFNKSSNFMIQSSFLIDKLSSDLNLKASNADVDAKLEEYAKQSGMELEQLKEFYNTPERRSQMSYQITEDRVVEHLINSAKVEELAADKLEELK